MMDLTLEWNGSQWLSAHAEPDILLTIDCETAEIVGSVRVPEATRQEIIAAIASQAPFRAWTWRTLQ